MNFDQLNLHPQLLNALTKAGYNEATPIQEKAIPMIMKGKDVRASAQTGTGKTATFLLPALHRLATPAEVKGLGPRVLIIAPTRELAMQIVSQSEKYSRYLKGIKTVCIVGGVPYRPQLQKLAKPHGILVATPGRLIDFINRGTIKLDSLEMLIIDEADRMFDMGFIESVEQIVAATPTSRQTILFSATMQGSVLKLSKRILNAPVEVIVKADTKTHQHVKQQFHYADSAQHKERLLRHILDQEEVQDVIVFTATKRRADRLVDSLCNDYQAAALHGDMNQRQRTRTIAHLRNGKINVLIATDVAARGIDVQTITHVVNFDLPNNVEDYVHRIGRTGRAGASGTACSFGGRNDKLFLKKIENFTKQLINVVTIPGLESRASSCRPSFNRRSSSPRKRHKHLGFSSKYRKSER